MPDGPVRAPSRERARRAPRVVRRVRGPAQQSKRLTRNVAVLRVVKVTWPFGADVLREAWTIELLAAGHCLAPPTRRRHEMSSQRIAVRRSLSILAFASVMAIGNAQTTATAGSAVADREARARSDYAKLPVAFVENVGQTDARVRYYAQGSRFAFYLTPNGSGAGVDEGARRCRRRARAAVHREQSAGPD